MRQFYAAVTATRPATETTGPRPPRPPALFSDGTRWTTAARARLLEAGYVAASGESLAVFRQSLEQATTRQDAGDEATAPDKMNTSDTDADKPLVVCSLPAWIELALHSTDTFEVR